MFDSLLGCFVESSSWGDVRSLWSDSLRDAGCYILAFDPAQNAIQGDAQEGSDTFQWQLGEEIAWAEIG